MIEIAHKCLSRFVLPGVAMDHCMTWLTHELADVTKHDQANISFVLVNVKTIVAYIKLKNEKPVIVKNSANVNFCSVIHNIKDFVS